MSIGKIKETEKIRKNNFLILFFLFAVLFFACKKPDSNTPIATLKGNITMTVNVMHHQWVIPGIPVYLKGNTTQYPGENTALYNLSVTTNQNGDAQFKELKYGNYYLYARGW